ncbi:MAG: tetratricopeptide repeat protein [Verrucomicrobia bacterium]|nr:tetratricopeptide repeat protein [Verrucomicrobiota bacterium]
MSSNATPARRPRPWWFPLAALALPALALVLLEGALRLAGAGYPAGFFLRDSIQDRAVHVENPEFGRRFFPPGLERTPEPLAIPTPKPAGTRRIFLFGESAAQGDPEPAFGCGRMLEALLQARYPAGRVEVVNVALTAINSHVIQCIARDCAAREGDVWVIYMGNNEVVGPFGAGTVFGAQVPHPAWIRTQLTLRATRVGQLVDALRWRRAAGRIPPTWEGMEMFLGQQVRQADPRLPAVYQAFERNLDTILDEARAAGVRVVLSTVASNLKDCPPFASLHRPEWNDPRLWSDARRAEWERHYRAGTNAEAAGRFPAAIEAYQAALPLDDTVAELWFRLSRCQYALGHYATAREGFSRARDHDTLRFRADSRLNRIVREAAQRHAAAGVTLLDAERVFDDHSPNGIAGEELFWDHVHPKVDGHYWLARAFAEAITPWPAAPAPGPTPAAPRAKPPPAPTADAWLTADECRRRLACTAWHHTRMLEEMVRRMELAPFTHQLDHEPRLRRLRQALAQSQSALDAPALDAAMATCREALQRSPSDWILHATLARLAQFNGHPPVAERHWRRVIDLMPHYLESYYSLGNLLDSRGESREAITCFQEALRRRPGLVEARNGLGLALANLGRVEEARREYEAALRRRPGFAEACVNLGQLLAREGRLEEARAHYERALRANSNSAAAHINLGKLLAGEGRMPEAAAHYRRALDAKPDNAIAHFNLGNALTALNDPAAAAHYAQAVRLQPDFTQAHHNLGLSLAREGRMAEALRHFREAVRLNPRAAESHLNLGVTFAKLGRYAEAAACFEETLRLDPGQAAARQYLDQARARARAAAATPPDGP